MIQVGVCEQHGDGCLPRGREERMHRLFGVTMAERGVSRLVSVDLKAAEELREDAA